MRAPLNSRRERSHSTSALIRLLNVLLLITPVPPPAEAEQLSRPAERMFQREKKEIVGAEESERTNGLRFLVAT